MGLLGRPEFELIQIVEDIEAIFFEAAEKILGNSEQGRDLVAVMTDIVVVGFISEAERERWRRALRVRNRILHDDPDDQVLAGVIRERMRDMVNLHDDLLQRVAKLRTGAP